MNLLICMSIQNSQLMEWTGKLISYTKNVVLVGVVYTGDRE